MLLSTLVVVFESETQDKMSAVNSIQGVVDNNDKIEIHYTIKMIPIEPGFSQRGDSVALVGNKTGKITISFLYII